jgi:hypothetical protein
MREVHLEGIDPGRSGPETGERTAGAAHRTREATAAARATPG